MKRIVYHLCERAVAIALLITAVSVNSTCPFVTYQPELPKGAERLKKWDRDE